MRLWHLTLLTLLTAEPASACRLHSIWHYPWPQHCPLPHSPAPAAEDKNWYVEIVLSPQVIDEISHGVGIEKIRELNQVPAKLMTPVAPSFK